MDNVLFNVNGNKDEDLLKAIELVASTTSYGDAAKFRGYAIDPLAGFVLLEHPNEKQKNVQVLPDAMTAAEILPIIQVYLRSGKSRILNLGQWECNLDHDGSNSEGWRVYVEDWGHIPVEGDKYSHYSSAVCAVKRVFLWHGK